MYGIERILGILPHRYPFLLVDRILEIEEGKRAVGLKNVTFNEPFFQGHFPGKPVMPGVLVLECMAQIGGVVLLSQPDNEGKLAYFAGIDRVKFRKPVVPGDTIISEVELVRQRGTMGKVRAVARVNDQIVTEAEFIFALVEGPESEGQKEEVLESVGAAGEV